MCSSNRCVRSNGMGNDHARLLTCICTKSGLVQYACVVQLHRSVECARRFHLVVASRAHVPHGGHRGEIPHSTERPDGGLGIGNHERCHVVLLCAHTGAS